MFDVDWSLVKHFKPSEFTRPEKMSALLIYSLDKLRKQAGSPIIVNSDYREGDSGQHGQGKAVDIVISGMNVVDQFLLAEKSRMFSGIGLYPFWNRPGIHVDVRELQLGEPAARWLRNAAGFYVAITQKQLRNL